MLTKPEAAHNPIHLDHRPSTSLPPQFAQMRRGLGTPALGAGSSGGCRRPRMLHPNNRKTGGYWGARMAADNRAAISQATEVVEEKSVTVTTTGELRRYMSERAMGFRTGTRLGCPRSRAVRDLGLLPTNIPLCPPSQQELGRCFYPAAMPWAERASCSSGRWKRYAGATTDRFRSDLRPGLEARGTRPLL